MLVLAVLPLACSSRCVLALFYPLRLHLSTICCVTAICFCLKSAQLLHDGRNVIQLRGKAVLVLSQIPFPLLCCSVVGHGAPHVQPHILLIQDRERLHTYF